MRLEITRSQRTAGMLGGKNLFELDAKLSMSDEESLLIKKYKLGGQSIYNSEQANKHLADAGNAIVSGATGNVFGLAKGLVKIGMAKLSLRMTIDSITKGQHFELNDLDEVLGAEAAIVEGCHAAKAYLQTALTFDGRTQVIEI